MRSVLRAYVVAPNYLKQAAKTSWSCHATGPFACYPQFPTACVSHYNAALLGSPAVLREIRTWPPLYLQPPS
ncbi:hypothetical protein ACN38_g6352 [Penicillium nordicum]|uniref:Uncharacterized protein n=1 Tax=Penicillium nordicum TaxID=229535 RepID=A0A0M8P3E2_9EURO|nr:hypothetical protein ACN38_g6352 [Penicillium nordicum]